MAWDEADISEERTGDVQTVTWSVKPGSPDVLYQIIVRVDPDDSATDVVAFPEAPTAGTSGSLKVSNLLRGKKFYYFVKYWKKTGAFNGATYYGQSRVRTLDFSE